MGQGRQEIAIVKYESCDRKRCASNFARKLLFLLVKSM